MEEEQRLTFTAEGKNGPDTEYEIMVEFSDEETSKTYIAYTDNIEDENGDLDVFICRKNTEGGKNFLDTIEDDAEYAKASRILYELLEEAEENEV